MYKNAWRINKTNYVTSAEGKPIMQDLDMQTYEDYLDIVIYD
jgi:hypothetical protein